MSNPMEFFRRGAEKRKADSLGDKSMYQPGGERPLTESDARLEKMQMLNDMGLMGDQNFIPNAGPKPGMEPGMEQMPPDSFIPPIRTEERAARQQKRSLAGQAMLEKLRKLQ